MTEYCPGSMVAAPPLVSIHGDRFNQVLDPTRKVHFECEDGQNMFKRLAQKADFVIESFPPGYMAELGLDYKRLAEINPGIIMTSITDFGQTGLYSN